MTECARLTTYTYGNEQFVKCKVVTLERAKKIAAKAKRYGIYSPTTMATAGFKYTGENDTAQCNHCNLTISDWTKDMKPFDVHADRSPDCPFVRSRLSQSSRKLNDQENPAKRRKTDSNSEQFTHNLRFVEVKSLQEIRCRTFSHWSRRIKPSAEQLITAGFFSCNVGDRVICIYCNLICQQWTANVDDPIEVHKTLSPRCPYVLSMLTYPELSPTLILNDVTTTNLNNPNTNQPRFDEIVYTTPCHPVYSDITKRIESFRTWSHESSPSTDDLVRAGFFYTGARNIVTCFYCNGSLQNWGATDNPVIEHARWFGQCPYAKQLCGDDLHRKIQEANRARQERDRTNQPNQRNQNSNTQGSNQSQLQINDTNMLSRLVAARLDLSSSQHLLDQNFKLSVIKRCWEDQLQLKKDDFVSDSDLFTACIILQKQIDHIQGNKDNIVVPSVRMKQIREGHQTGQEPLPTTSNDNKQTELQNHSVPTTDTKTSEINSTKTTAPSNPCIICYQDDKRLACIPCGHFTSCVPCSHTLRTCPICRRSIEAFVRIYI